MTGTCPPTLNISSLVHKAHQSLFFLRRLKKAHLPIQILVNFYSCTIERVLTTYSTLWYSNCSQTERLCRGW